MKGQLKPWYAAATPHEDIRQGRLSESVFAADIWAVKEGTAHEVYLDPEAFFTKTYMTVGLCSMLKRVASALRGDHTAGNRVISLQTSFGGGKTHILLALWHLARHTERLRRSRVRSKLESALGGPIPDEVQNVAVFTNQTCDPTQGRKMPDGIMTRTLWGELAYQLGGPSLYERIRPNDENRGAPKGKFVDVLRAATPCLILLDELADYCVAAGAVAYAGTTLADQTISFIQELTQAVDQVPGTVVVATLPASKAEVAQSEKGQEAFATLEKRFERLGADIKPVADDEIYEVVRARLFESVAPEDDPHYPEEVAETYQSVYASHAGEVPPDVVKLDYRSLIARSYPFHPILIEALYTRWGGDPDFQRTRGVLRLLASLIGDLWQRRDTNTQSQPLIQPCHVRWSVDAWQGALTRYWGQEYQAVAAADVTGERSNAATTDEERGDEYRREYIAQGLAAAILLGSFGSHGERSGFSAKDLRLACSRPGLNWNYTDSALVALEERAFYLHATAAGSLGKRYWFSTKPNLNKLIVQYRQQHAGKNFDDDIIESLRAEVRKMSHGEAMWKVVVDPQPDLPEQKSLALLVLPPKLAWNGNGDEDSCDQVRLYVLGLSTKCGNKNREFRNTLVFLAPTGRGIGKLRQAYRERAALDRVQRDYSSRLDAEQRQDLQGRLDAAKKACGEVLGAAYTVALRVGGDAVEAATISDTRPTFGAHLDYVWSVLVKEEEWILRRLGSVTLQQSGLVPKEAPIRLKDAIEAFLRFTDKPIIASKNAVTESLKQACQEGLIGIGKGTSPSNFHAKHCRESVTLDPSDEGVWVVPPFEREQPVGEHVPADTTQPPAKGTRTETDVARETKPNTTGAKRPTVRRLTIRGSVPSENWPDVFRSFVGPAAQMHPKKLQLGIEFDIEAAEDGLDPDDQRLKSMREAARQLGLEFEESE